MKESMGEICHKDAFIEVRLAIFPRFPFIVIEIDFAFRTEFQGFFIIPFLKIQFFHVVLQLFNLVQDKLALLADESLPFLQAFIATLSQFGIFADALDGHARIFQAGQQVEPADIHIAEETDTVFPFHLGQQPFFVIIADGRRTDASHLRRL